MNRTKLSASALTLGIVIVMILAMSGLALAQPADQSPTPKVTDIGFDAPTSVLFVGNSFFYYNNSMHGHVSRMVAEGLPRSKCRFTSVTISGAGLDWHDVESYFHPNGIGAYSTSNDGKNRVTFNDPKQQLFDVVIMMDNSQGPIHPQLKSLFVETAKKDSAIVRRHGAKPVFFMSWAYADKPEMTQMLDAAYTKTANDNDALVIPAGLAFAKSLARRPDIKLTIADQRHPTLAGTYLAAATVYVTLFKQYPVGMKYTAGLDPEVAGFLQEVAWETVQEYFNR